MSENTLTDSSLEATIVDAMMAGDRACAVAVRELQPRDFAWDRPRELFEAITHAYQHGRPTDTVSVMAELRTHGDMRLVRYLEATVGVHSPSDPSIEFHVAELRSLALQRRIREAGGRIIDIASGPGEADAKLAQAHAALASIAQASSDVTTAAKLADEVLELIQQMADGKVEGVVSTGLVDLDRKLGGGLWPGHLVVVGARPSVGKSALAANIALRAMKLGTGVLFCSLEMSAREIAARWVADTKSRALWRVTGGEMAEFANLLASLPVRMIGAPASVNTIRADAFQMRDGLGLVVVDYLQLLSGSKRDNRALEVGEYARGLKLLARELNVPVLALAQLNRETERQDRKPRLSDLRDSGEIEAHADEVILLHRAIDSSEAEAILAKQRNGPTGYLHLHYLPEIMRFAGSAS